jgi:regulator of replication initiation timing
MNMIQVMADELADMREENKRLKRENSILRTELVDRMAQIWVNLEGMDNVGDEEADAFGARYVDLLLKHSKEEE